MVTETDDGCARADWTPGRLATVTGTLCAPGPRSCKSIVATTSFTSTSERTGAGPVNTTVMVGAAPSRLSPEPRLVTTAGTVKEYSAWLGSMLMDTVTTGAPPGTVTPAGRSSETVRSMSSAAPLMSI